ncbi:3' terminal RNA ribose 2'-O-methyltransferase Hen1 [Cellulomonas cellasea]|uniref:Small RNA 2'-O-methyltransferase n=1 Tax=Cellulomonas cellasea TaxID=43670 RepID=A0A7W4YA55_9CELL|nr:3' terminal RNA ribose 2'-O-methyltransferase Hen1 [Cellulomonas cellasea]MBB2922390.1 SAM-dependent methyltransferase [Cellulomonas cellasea]
MLLELTTETDDASDLGFLLHKHPARVQAFEQSVGVAHVFYPEADERRCTVALLLEVDPVALVRGKGRGSRDSAFSLAEYVNDRPYAASSMLAVALGRVFRSAMAGRCEARPELPGREWPLEVRVPAVPCRGGVEAAVRLFEPLGWTVRATPVPLDPQVPAWGDSRYVDLHLTGTMRVADALSHLYVLLPTLDVAKHYWVGTDEVDKLVRAGEGWLARHPAREEIARRYLANRRVLADSAVARLAEVDDVLPDADDDSVAEEQPDDASTVDGDPGGDVQASADGSATPEDPATPDDLAATHDAEPEPEPGPTRAPLARLRVDAVVAQLRAVGARSVVDLGCGEGVLLRALLREKGVERVLGVDVSHRALELAARRLHLDTLPERVRARVELAQSSVTYTDARVAGFDAAVLMEVIEHVDPPRLGALEHAVFGAASPATVVVTTPNAEHNVRYPTLAAGSMRHHDHRFEWTRAELAAWAHATAGRYGYGVELLPVGEDDPDVGPPTQMAVFRRTEEGAR